MSEKTVPIKHCALRRELFDVGSCGSAAPVSTHPLHQQVGHGAHDVQVPVDLLGTRRVQRMSLAQELFSAFLKHHVRSENKIFPKDQIFALYEELSVYI